MQKQKKTKRFRVDPNLKEHVRNVLSREGVSHRFITEEGQMYCLTSISGERFHKAVKRARCEKLTEESGILHLTYPESQNSILVEGLMRLFGKNSYVVLSEKKK